MSRTCFCSPFRAAGYRKGSRVVIVIILITSNSDSNSISKTSKNRNTSNDNYKAGFACQLCSEEDFCQHCAYL